MSGIVPKPLEIHSDALNFAVASGLPTQMNYTVAETSKYLGISENTLRAEIKALRLRPITITGKQRSTVLPVREVDRWLSECSRR